MVLVAVTSPPYSPPLPVESRVGAVSADVAL